MSEKKPRLETSADILEAALRKEKASYNFYNNLLKNTRVGILVETLDQLRAEEYRHIRIIEKKLAKMGLG